MVDIEAIATEAIDCGLRLHRRLGPGLFESVYDVLLVESALLIELKSVERLAPVSMKQVLTYLRLLDLPLGLLMNFGDETFRAGLRRVANNLSAFSSPSRLCVNPSSSNTDTRR